MRIKKESERILLLTVSKIQDLEDARFVRPMRKRLLRVFDGLALNSRKERRIRRIKSSKRSGGGWNRFESDERSRSLESRRTLPLFLDSCVAGSLLSLPLGYYFLLRNLLFHSLAVSILFPSFFPSHCPLQTFSSTTQSTFLPSLSSSFNMPSFPK